MAYSEYDDWDLRALSERIFLQWVAKSNHINIATWQVETFAMLAIETAKAFEKTWNAKLKEKAAKQAAKQRKKGKA
jgi:hypothetical protein